MGRGEARENKLASVLEVKTAVPADEQRLIFPGRHVEGACALADYGVAAGSSLHSLLRLIGGGDVLPSRNECIFTGDLAAYRLPGQWAHGTPLSDVWRKLIGHKKACVVVSGAIHLTVGSDAIESPGVNFIPFRATADQ